MNEFVMLLWIFGCIGMTHIIVESDISKKFKDFIEPYTPNFIFKALGCYQCTGFWSGVIITTAYLIMQDNINDFWFLIFVGGCASSFLSTFSAILLTYFEANSMVRE
jgi:hypothetical protein